MKRHNDTPARSTVTRHPIACGAAAILLCWLSTTLTGCHHGADHPNAPAEKHATPDSLIISIDDVRQIAGQPGLQPNPKGDEQQPHPPNASAPGPCQVESGQKVAFGDAWTQFRGVSYSELSGTIPGGPKGMSVINQAVGVYPDSNAAHGAFDKLLPQLTACAALHAKFHDFTITQPDPSTITLTYTGHLEAVSTYNVQSPYLIQVSAWGVPHSGQTAHEVLQKIIDRTH
jgi:hypothetical protein